MASFTFERKVNLPLNKVWALIGDWGQTPGPDIQVKIEKEGDPAQHGAGTIRTIKIGNVKVREVLDSASPPNSFNYRIIGNPLMKEYIGHANFEDDAGSTKIRWQADIKPMIPLTGPICVKLATGSVSKLIDSLEKHNA
jgi:hypothetical protein